MREDMIWSSEPIMREAEASIGPWTGAIGAIDRTNEPRPLIPEWRVSPTEEWGEPTPDPMKGMTEVQKLEYLHARNVNPFEESTKGKRYSIEDLYESGVEFQMRVIGEFVRNQDPLVRLNVSTS